MVKQLAVLNTSNRRNRKAVHIMAYKKNEIVQQKKTGITTYLSSEAVKNNIMSVVGEKNTTRFISSIVSAVQTNPALAECTNNSILSSALLGESLKLTPSPQLGQYYMVPYDNSKTRKSKFYEQK